MQNPVKLGLYSDEEKPQAVAELFASPLTTSLCLKPSAPIITRPVI